MTSVNDNNPKVCWYEDWAGCERISERLRVVIVLNKYQNADTVRNFFNQASSIRNCFWEIAADIEASVPASIPSRFTPCRFSLGKRNKVARYSYPSQSHVLRSSCRAKYPASWGSARQARCLITIYEEFSYICVTQKNRRSSRLPGNTIMKAR